MSLEQTACEEDWTTVGLPVTHGVLAVLQGRTVTLHPQGHRLLATSSHDPSSPLPVSSEADLKAFERRLTEVIARLQPATTRWRMVLVIVAVCTALGAYLWLTDPVTQDATFLQSLLNHLFFTFAASALILLFIMGIHRKVVSPSIITSRTRAVLVDFNMSCDDTGKLILKPRPTTT